MPHCKRYFKGLGRFDPFRIVMDRIIIERGHGIFPKGFLTDGSDEWGKDIPRIHGFKGQFFHFSLP
jgi:hypothetical protein